MSIKRGHLGRDKTLAKIQSRFYWKNANDDIIEHCDKCQVNAKFTKSDTKLHPIPVPSKVWHQVSFFVTSYAYYNIT